jgi:L-rhamnose mutarotase
MYSIALKLKLKPGCYIGYKESHDNLWPELADSMSRSNVNMAIYRDGHYLLVFASAPTEADWLHSREDPILRRWNELMTSFLETDTNGNIVCDRLEKSFGFGAYSFSH